MRSRGGAGGQPSTLRKVAPAHPVASALLDVEKRRTFRADVSMTGADVSWPTPPSSSRRRAADRERRSRQTSGGYKRAGTAASVENGRANGRPLVHDAQQPLLPGSICPVVVLAIKTFGDCARVSPGAPAGRAPMMRVIFLIGQHRAWHRKLLLLRPLNDVAQCTFWPFCLLHRYASLVSSCSAVCFRSERAYHWPVHTSVICLPTCA